MKVSYLWLCLKVRCRRKQGYWNQSLHYKHQAHGVSYFILPVYFYRVGQGGIHGKEGLCSQSLKMTEKITPISKYFLLNLTNEAVKPFRIRTAYSPFVYLPHHIVFCAEGIFHGCLLNEWISNFERNKRKKGGDEEEKEMEEGREKRQVGERIINR